MKTADSEMDEQVSSVADRLNQYQSSTLISMTPRTDEIQLRDMLKVLSDLLSAYELKLAMQLLEVWADAPTADVIIGITVETFQKDLQRYLTSSSSCGPGREYLQGLVRKVAERDGSRTSKDSETPRGLVKQAAQTTSNVQQGDTVAAQGSLTSRSKLESKVTFEQEDACNSERTSEGNSNKWHSEASQVSAAMKSRSIRKGFSFLIDEQSSQIKILNDQWYSIPTHKFVIHPIGHFRLTWDACALFLILSEAVLVPLSMAFDVDFDEGVAWVMTAFFMIDIFLNFATGFFHEGCLVMKQVLIVQHYLRGWFLLDLIATIPWNVFFTETSTGNATLVRVVKAGKFIRVLRLLRLMKLKRMVEKCEEIVNSSMLVSFMKMSKIILFIALLCHWAACIWAWIGHPDRMEGTVPADPNLCDPGGPCERGVVGSPWLRRYNLEGETVPIQYVYALRFATGLLTVSEFGVEPGWWLEQIFVTLAMFFSFISSSIVISMIFEMLTRIRQESLEQEELMMTFRELMILGHVPLTLQMKVRRYLEFQFHSRKQVQVRQSAMMERLSPWLRKELLVHINKRVLQQHPIFEFMLEDILSHACCLTVSMLCAPGDVVMQLGKVTDCAYFVVRGKLAIEMQTRAKAGGPLMGESGDDLKYSDFKGTLLTAPAFIGGKSLLESQVCKYTVSSVTHSELLSFAREAFNELISQFPELEPYLNQLKSSRHGIPDSSLELTVPSEGANAGTSSGLLRTSFRQLQASARSSYGSTNSNGGAQAQEKENSAQANDHALI
eukprot:TRINITY_DN13899_c0_g1_i1.p1 TRINITY_DN13899_c0_g1~~TRINITY_DN13899_c0_g1_i1.p1  ORF type:complete len:796 (+),score=72.49 TRINITY_DN13899_c0_g1_i1:48-2390(+)